MSIQRIAGIAVFIVLIISSMLLAGCPSIDGRPPEYSIDNPYAVPDGSSGIVVSYQVNSGNAVHIRMQRLGEQGDALWEEKGIDLASGSMGFTGGWGDFAPLVTDGHGNVTVVYSQNKNIWATKLDMDGSPVWEGEGIRQLSPDDVPATAYFRAIGNGTGEIIIAWISGKGRLTLQKCDGPKAYFTTVSTPDVDRFDITGDDSGNVFILWKDNPGYGEGNLSVQKVDADAEVTWPSGGLQLTGTRNPGLVWSDLVHMITSDGESGVTALRVQGTLSEDGKLITGRELYAQRIDSTGHPLWGENGIYIMKAAHEPSIMASQSGETVVLWTDLQTIYAQRLDAEGNAEWPEVGIEVGQAGEHNNVIYFDATGDDAGGAVVVWNYSENGNVSLRAQRLDAGGNKLWGDDGIRVSTVSPYWGGYSTPARILPDADGRFIVTWAAGEYIKDKTSSRIQRISSDGMLLWGEDGIRLNP